MDWLRGIGVWLAIIACESLHGTLRELLLTPRIGALRAHQVTVFTGSLLIIGVATALARWLDVRDPRMLIRLGLLWVVLTVAFEALLGRFVLGMSWSQISADYDLARGGFMTFGLLVLTLAPLIGARLRGLVGNDRPAG
jgi:uncharacterized BrkB/YihY/UPF0761 family membrane protein